MRILVVPGNGGCGNDILGTNWYGWLRDELNKRNISNVVENFPDPYVARQSIWLPHIKNTLGLTEETVIVGHSSGALAAMRLAEQESLKGVILVSAAHTDLGDENERASGYFDEPWNWAKMVANTRDFIVQFHSEDDHLIPVEEARFVAKSLQEAKASAGASASCMVTYQELQGKGHFFHPFSEIISIIEEKAKEG